MLPIQILHYPWQWVMCFVSLIHKKYKYVFIYKLILVALKLSQKYSNMQFQFIYIVVWLITFYHWMLSYFVGTPNTINSFTYWKTSHLDFFLIIISSVKDITFFWSCLVFKNFCWNVTSCISDYNKVRRPLVFSCSSG